MIVELRFDRDRSRRWMQRVVGTLVQQKFDVRVTWVEAAAKKPPGLELLFDLERMLLRKGAAGGADPLSREEIANAHMPDGDADIVIDLSNSEQKNATGNARWLKPLYNGVAGEDGILGAVLAGDLPCIEICDVARGEVVARGMPSAENAAGLSGALDTTMARTLTLVLAALKGGVSGQDVAARTATRKPASAAPHVLKGLASHLVREIYRLCCYAPHWHVGWRFVDDEGVWQRGDLSGPAWKVIADPKVHFYAGTSAAVDRLGGRSRGGRS